MGLFDSVFGKKSIGNGSIPIDVAYAYWSCSDDGNSCGVCRQYDGIHWIPELIEMPTIPLASCRQSRGCQCIIVYISKDTHWAKDLSEFIRRMGGKVTSEQVDGYDQAKSAEVGGMRSKEHLASEKAMAAREVERTCPEDAIAFYRESIAITKELARDYPNQWRWRDFPYLYNRLTILLERLGRYQEALSEIDKYMILPVGQLGSKAERGGIEKRKVRLSERLKKKMLGDGG